MPLRECGCSDQDGSYHLVRGLVAGDALPFWLHVGGVGGVGLEFKKRWGRTEPGVGLGGEDKG